MRLVSKLSLVVILGTCVLAATPTMAWAQEEAEATEEADKPRWGVGARLRYISVPNWLLGLFLDHATQLSSYSIGGEIVRRKGDLDIAVSIDWTDANADAGLFLEKGDNPANPATAPDYTTFEDFGMISADVSFIWHANLHERFQLRYGGGIGVGIMTGKINQEATVCPAGTTASQLDDPNHCTRTGMVEEADVPPALPVVNVLLGGRVKIMDQLTLNIEGGFRNAFFFGAGLGYFF